MAKALTDRTIKALKPAMARTELADGGMPGLYFVLQPSGVSSWAYRYRSPLDGKPKKLTIGRYPAFTLADARRAAREAARAVAERRDPGAEKAAAKTGSGKQSDLVKDLLDDFVSKHVIPNTRPASAAESQRLIERELKPEWGARRVQTIMKRDVIKLLDEIVDRGAVVLANRVLALVRKFMNWLQARAVIEANPAAGVASPSAEVSRDRILNDDEIRWLWQACGSDQMGAAVKLLLLTGQRRSEVAGMCDAEIGKDIWHIPGARTKNGVAHAVPLVTLARQVIGTVPRIKDSDLVLTTTGKTPISGWSKSKAAIDRAMLELAKKEVKERGQDPLKVVITPWRLHDLRRTAASGMARLGHPVHVVEALLNHRSGTVSGVAAVYNRYDYAPEKRQAAEAWAAHVATLAGISAAEIARA